MPTARVRAPRAPASRDASPFPEKTAAERGAGKPLYTAKPPQRQVPFDKREQKVSATSSDKARPGRAEQTVAVIAPPSHARRER